MESSTHIYRSSRSDGRVLHTYKINIHSTHIYIYLYQWHTFLLVCVCVCVCVASKDSREREGGSLYNSRRRGLFECGLDGYQETIVIDDDTLEREDETRSYRRRPAAATVSTRSPHSIGRVPPFFSWWCIAIASFSLSVWRITFKFDSLGFFFLNLFRPSFSYFHAGCLFWYQRVPMASWLPPTERDVG